MSENLFDLYSQKILALATDIPLTKPIENADATVKRRSPICGSEVEVSLHVENGVITDYAQVVNACALGQASSAILWGGLSPLTHNTPGKQCHNSLTDTPYLLTAR